MESRKNIYKNEAILYQGVGVITQLITVAVVVVGGAGILNASFDLADLITFLLYIGSLIEPIQKLPHMTEQYQEGITGFERFMEIMEIEPEIQDAPGAVELSRVRGRVEFRNVGFKYNGSHDVCLEEHLAGTSARRIPWPWWAHRGSAKPRCAR